MESDAEAGRYHRYHEPDPEMEDGCDGNPHKPFYATVRKSCSNSTGVRSLNVTFMFRGGT